MDGLDFARKTIDGRATVRSVFKELRAQNMPVTKAFHWGKHIAVTVAKNSAKGIRFGVYGIAISAIEAVGATAEAVATKDYVAKVAASSKALGAIAAFGTTS